jgi:hypothetical protein
MFVSHYFLSIIEIDNLCIGGRVMKKIVTGILSMGLLMSAATQVDAHPGRTDSNGGHYCRTNCEKWGLSYGEYHYHNGGGSSSGSTSGSKTTAPKVTKPKPVLVTATVYINGVKQVFDQSAYIKDGTTLVPMRPIFEALGADVQYDGNTKKVTGVKSSKTVVLSVGNRKAYLKEKGITSSIELSHPAEITNGSTMVPLRFISESLGANVQWDSVNRSVKITK